MKRTLLLLTASLALTACTGGPDTPHPNPDPGPVTPAGSFTLVMPATLSLQTGTPTQFTPSVQRSNYDQAITFDAAGSAGLSVTRQGDGFMLMVLAPGSYTLTVTARGADGQVKTGMVTVNAATTPQPEPQPQPKPVFLPGAGAPVGSGDGTKEGTVYVSPSAQEVEVLNLVNEVRTKGTLNGSPATAGTCVDGSWSPRPALTYNGLFAYAARKHAEYMANVGYEFHTESQTGSPYFYGSQPRDRVVRAYREQAGLSKSYYGDNNTYDGGELVVPGRTTALAALQSWLQSPSHCAALMSNGLQQAAAGFADAPTDVVTNRWGTSWALIVSR